MKTYIISYDQFRDGECIGSSDFVFSGESVLEAIDALHVKEHDCYVTIRSIFSEPC